MLSGISSQCLLIFLSNLTNNPPPFEVSSKRLNNLVKSCTQSGTQASVVGYRTVSKSTQGKPERQAEVHTGFPERTDAYMPTPKLHFQEQKSPKSRTQYHFQEHISKCIPTFMKTIQLPDFMGKSQGNLPYWFSAAKNAVSAHHAWLSASPIIPQQSCELHSSCRCHLPRQCWWKATSRGMLS